MVTEHVHRVWNSDIASHPARVVACASTAEVQAAVRSARAEGLPLSVLGGGHDWAGRAIREGGVVLDLGGLRSVSIGEGVAVVGGGVTVSDVLDAALPLGLAAVVGTVGSVGVVGLLLGGGLSPLSGVTGLGADNLLRAEVVLADGSVIDTDDEPELLWALRGGGGNFGVVTSATLALHPLAEVTTLDELCPAGGHYYASTRTLPVPFPVDALVEVAEAMPPTGMLNVHHLHGAAVARSVDATAYAYRDEHVVVELIGYWHEGDGSDVKAWVARAESLLEPHALPGGWPSLMRPDDPRAREAFGPNLPRLKAAKAHYDPANTWSGIPTL